MAAPSGKYWNWLLAQACGFDADKRPCLTYYSNWLVCTRVREWQSGRSPPCLWWWNCVHVMTLLLGAFFGGDPLSHWIATNEIHVWIFWITAQSPTFPTQERRFSVLSVNNFLSKTAHWKIHTVYIVFFPQNGCKKIIARIFHFASHLTYLCLAPWQIVRFKICQSFFSCQLWYLTFFIW